MAPMEFRVVVNGPRPPLRFTYNPLVGLDNAMPSSKIPCAGPARILSLTRSGAAAPLSVGWAGVFMFPLAAVFVARFIVDNFSVLHAILTERRPPSGCQTRHPRTRMLLFT